MKLFGLEINGALSRSRMIERRRVPRFPIHETLYLNYHNLPLERKGFAEGKDISPFGLRFACHSKFDKGTPLDVTLRFHPESSLKEPLRIRARVVHCYRKKRQRRFRIGCEFEEPDAFSQDQIRSFIYWLRGREFGNTVLPVSGHQNRLDI